MPRIRIIWPCLDTLIELELETNSYFSSKLTLTLERCLDVRFRLTINALFQLYVPSPMPTVVCGTHMSVSFNPSPPYLPPSPSLLPMLASLPTPAPVLPPRTGAPFSWRLRSLPPFPHGLLLYSSSAQAEVKLTEDDARPAHGTAPLLLSVGGGGARKGGSSSLGGPSLWSPPRSSSRSTTGTVCAWRRLDVCRGLGTAATRGMPDRAPDRTRAWVSATRQAGTSNCSTRIR